LIVFDFTVTQILGQRGAFGYGEQRPFSESVANSGLRTVAAMWLPTRLLPHHGRGQAVPAAGTHAVSRRFHIPGTGSAPRGLFRGPHHRWQQSLHALRRIG